MKCSNSYLTHYCCFGDIHGNNRSQGVEQRLKENCPKYSKNKKKYFVGVKNQCWTAHKENPFEKNSQRLKF